MGFLHLDRLLGFLTGTEFLLGLLYAAIAGIAVALVVLITTRWGQSRPLEKCLFLSVLVHVWLAAFSMTVRIIRPSLEGGQPVVRIRLVDAPLDKMSSAEPLRPEPEPPPAASAAPQPPPKPPVEPIRVPPAKSRAGVRAVVAESEKPLVGVEEYLKPPSPSPAAKGEPAPGASEPRPRTASIGVGPPQLPRNPPGRSSHEAPEIYRLRTAPDRDQVAKQLGSMPEGEAAVRAALKWLVENQEPDGRWSATRHGAGKESMEAGRDREGAGSKADTGVTGLALLALTAAGNTHLEGTYSSSVQEGVEYLLRVQAADGNLAGDAEFYGFMYCHGMAAFALGDLLGMSGDRRLREPVRRAVAYIVAAQDPSGGGWRYRPRDPGDMSQLGWQLMALKSAEVAGIPIPEATWFGANRFLDSVSGGNHRGLAAYRPGERYTRTMTAEALACRHFLGMAQESPAFREASDYLLGELPGDGPGNLYYWYYGTLGLYPLQGPHWRLWSEALQKTLTASQQKSGPLAGSWDPNTRWDSYGGRVYSTALAALCLETYYRFFPLHAGASPRDGTAR